ALAGCGSHSDELLPGTSAAAGCAPPLSASVDDARPLTIPALRLWEPGSGAYMLEADTRIVAAPELMEVAATFAEDLAAQQERAFELAAGGARRGDIVLALSDCDERLGGEGYLLGVGE